MREIHKRTTFALLLHFHFGECFLGVWHTSLVIFSPHSTFFFLRKKKKTNKKQNRKRKTKGDFHGSSSFTIYDSFSAPFSLNAYNWLVWPYTKRRRRLYARWCCCWCSCSTFNRLSLKYTKKNAIAARQRRCKETTLVLQSTQNQVFIYFFSFPTIYVSLFFFHTRSQYEQKIGKIVKAIIIEFSAGHSAEAIFHWLLNSICPFFQDLTNIIRYYYEKAAYKVQFSSDAYLVNPREKSNDERESQRIECIILWFVYSFPFRWRYLVGHFIGKRHVR